VVNQARGPRSPYGLDAFAAAALGIVDSSARQLRISPFVHCFEARMPLIGLAFERRVDMPSAEPVKPDETAWW
jgi:hypothetical protein